MPDIIFCAKDENALLAEAKRLNFIDSNGDIIMSEALANGGAWTLSIVGAITESIDNSIDAKYRPGYWGRLRINGSVSQMPEFSSSITQYIWSDKLKAWTSDNKTAAPEWVSFVGVMT